LPNYYLKLTDYAKSCNDTKDSFKGISNAYLVEKFFQFFEINPKAPEKALKINPIQTLKTKKRQCVAAFF